MKQRLSRRWAAVPLLAALTGKAWHAALLPPLAQSN